MPDLPFLDSFGHYLTADSSQKWTSGNTIRSAVGRRGNPAAVVTGNGITKTFDSEYATLYVGGAFYNPGNSCFHFLNQLNGLNASLHAIGDGRFHIIGTDPTDGSLLPPPFFSGAITPPLLADIWYYLEMSASISSTGISVVVNINGDQVLTDSAIFANPDDLGSHKSWASINIQGRGGGLETFLNDFYVDVDGFYGDVIIGIIRPAGPSATAWVPDPNQPNWLNVKDITPDYDVTTVSSTVVGDLDLYTMEQIPPNLTIRAIQGVSSVKKDTAGLAALKLQYGSGVGALQSAEYFPSQNSYTMLRDGRKDASLMSSAAINSLVFGQIRTQ